MIDLAVIKIKDWEKFIKENRISYLKFASKHSIENLETVYSIGHPWGLTWTISKGVISNKLRRPAASPKTLIQTDAKVYEGNSGGPLLDENGAVVGVNNLMVSKTGGSYGFAITGPLVEKVLRDYEKYKESRWPVLGILIGSDGLINEVNDDSAAKAAGIKPNDKIVSLQTKYGITFFENYDEFLYELSLSDYQNPIRLLVSRDGKIINIEIKPKFKKSSEFPATSTPP